MATKNSSMLSLGLVSCIALSAGCGKAELEVSNQSFSGPIANGLTMNGVSTNGVSVNGLTMNGLTMNGQTVNGLTMNGLTMNGLTMSGLVLEGSSFRADLNGTAISGLGFIGAQFQMTSQPLGLPVIRYTIRIDNIYVDPQNLNSDVYLYDISYVRDGEMTWNSVCADTQGNPVAAIPILNYWNTDTGARIDNASVVTFACVSGALGKCVRLRYRPWAQATYCDKGVCSAVELKDYHQACTRMIRADYCGNGRAYTTNGTLIDVYDALSPQIQRSTQDWPIEAQWNPGGGFCIGDARHAELLSKGRYPDCDGDGAADTLPMCGNNQTLKRALLGSRFNSSPG